MAFEAEVEQAKGLAVRAGSILLDHYAKRSSVTWKAPGDPVTEADRVANDFLTKELHRAHPDDGVLSEEAPDDRSRLTKRRVWMVDPIDGTLEFVSHVGEFAVMIGLAVEGRSVAGVVYQPTTGRLYYAVEGGGAFVEHAGARVRLSVSSESDPSQATLALSRSHQSARVDLVRRRLGISKTILSGSIGLKIGLICERRADLYLQLGSRTHQWDICAPEVILREAGGIATDAHNHPLIYNRSESRNLHGIIAGNSAMHRLAVDAAGAVLGGGENGL